jgi:hypothetical protein
MNLEMHMQPQKTPRSANALQSGFRNEGELDELLDLVTTARSRRTAPTALPAPAPPPVAAQEPDPVPAPKSRNDIFTAYLQFERDLSRMSAEQGHLQKLLFGEDWSIIVDHPSTQGIYRVAEKAITNLVQIARQRFAPAGVVLDISQHEVLEATGMSRWSEEYHRPSRRADRSEAESVPPVDLDKLWNYLEATYGGDAGIQRAHRQNANLIIKEFRLDSETEMKRTASAVSCFRRIYTTKKDYGRDIGRYDFGHSSRDWLLELFKGLACAFEWTEMDQLSIELAPARHGICNYDFSFKPRDRHSFNGLEIIFFKEQMEFKFSHAAAEKLMLYLGTFGQA